MIKIKVDFLGTSCMVPTKDRNHSGYLIRYKTDGILMDCCEGLQRQFKIAKIKPSKVTKILISHWHGDHVLGIPGLMENLSWAGYDKVLEIYGPKGTEKKIRQLKEIFKSHISIKFIVKDIHEGIFYENDDYKLEAYELKHSMETFGYRFIEKDKQKVDLKKAKKLGLEEGPTLGKLLKNKSIKIDGKTIKSENITNIEKGRIISYISDTKLCKGCYKVAQDSNLLIAESTYLEDDEVKAEEYNHLTCSQTSNIAKESNVKSLVLTHFSQRYKEDKDFLKQAKKIFKNTKCAYDFMNIEL
ncbi:ribonuclease Z [Candidatus Woesearchaeota archaeon]|nr:ribonuclease Z [Candidatus Woesearchaeota archaeon]